MGDLLGIPRSAVGPSTGGDQTVNVMTSQPQLRNLAVPAGISLLPKSKVNLCILCKESKVKKMVVK